MTVVVAVLVVVRGGVWAEVVVFGEEVIVVVITGVLCYCTTLCRRRTQPCSRYTSR